MGNVPGGHAQGVQGLRRVKVGTSRKSSSSKYSAWVKAAAHQQHISNAVFQRPCGTAPPRFSSSSSSRKLPSVTAFQFGEIVRHVVLHGVFRRREQGCAQILLMLQLAKAVLQRFNDFRFIFWPHQPREGQAGESGPRGCRKCQSSISAGACQYARRQKRQCRLRPGLPSAQIAGSIARSPGRRWRPGAGRRLSNCSSKVRSVIAAGRGKKRLPLCRSCHICAGVSRYSSVRALYNIAIRRTSFFLLSFQSRSPPLPGNRKAVDLGDVIAQPAGHSCNIGAGCNAAV